MVPTADFFWILPDGSQKAGKTLSIQKAQSRDSGDYICTATIMQNFQQIQTAKTVNLQVHFAPVPVTESRIIYSYPNKQTEIICEFEANPTANTTLTGNGQTSVVGNSISRKFIPKGI